MPVTAIVISFWLYSRCVITTAITILFSITHSLWNLLSSLQSQCSQQFRYFLENIFCNHFFRFNVFHLLGRSRLVCGPEQILKITHNPLIRQRHMWKIPNYLRRLKLDILKWRQMDTRHIISLRPPKDLNWIRNEKWIKFLLYIFNQISWILNKHL